MENLVKNIYCIFRWRWKFRGLINDLVNIDGEKVEALHIGRAYGIVVNILNYLEKYDKKNPPEFFILKKSKRGNKIKVFISDLVPDYSIQWKQTN